MTTNNPISVLREAAQAMLNEYRSVIGFPSCRQDEAEDITSALTKALAATEQAAIQPAGAVATVIKFGASRQWMSESLGALPDGTYSLYLAAPLAPQDEKAEQVATAADWSEDFAHENGNYENRCSDCGIGFMGHKRRTICKVCAPAAQQAKAEQVGTVMQAMMDAPANIAKRADTTPKGNMLGEFPATPASKPEAGELPDLPVHDGLTLTMPNRYKVCELLCYGPMDPTKKTSLYTADAMRAYGQLCRDTAIGTRAASGSIGLREKLCEECGSDLNRGDHWPACSKRDARQPVAAPSNPPLKVPHAKDPKC